MGYQTKMNSLTSRNKWQLWLPKAMLITQNKTERLMGLDARSSVLLSHLPLWQYLSSYLIQLLSRGRQPLCRQHTERTLEEGTFVMYPSSERGNASTLSTVRPEDLGSWKARFSKSPSQGGSEVKSDSCRAVSGKFFLHGKHAEL